MSESRVKIDSLINHGARHVTFRRHVSGQLTTTDVTIPYAQLFQTMAAVLVHQHNDEKAQLEFEARERAKQETLARTYDLKITP